MRPYLHGWEGSAKLSLLNLWLSREEPAPYSDAGQASTGTVEFLSPGSNSRVDRAALDAAAHSCTIGAHR